MFSVKEQQNKGQEVSTINSKVGGEERNMIIVGIQDTMAQNTKTPMAKCKLFPGSEFRSIVNKTI